VHPPAAVLAVPVKPSSGRTAAIVVAMLLLLGVVGAQFLIARRLRLN
jgi:hypothetical protein